MRSEEAASISFVTPKIFLGDICDAQNHELLGNYKIKSILSMCNRPQEELPTINYLHFPLNETIHDHVSNYDWLKLWTFVNESEGNVLIHCAAGVNRSPFITTGLLMLAWGKSFDHCYKHIKNVRPCADIMDHYKGILRNIANWNFITVED